MEWQYHDGGRKDAGYQGHAGDCFCRALAIVLGGSAEDYRRAYDLVNEIAKRERPRKGRSRSSARTGVYNHTARRVMEHLGWKWHPTMGIGTGCRVHLRAEELPPGRILCNVSKHYVAVVDGVALDTHDPTRGGTRCVYGYFTREGR